MPRDSIGDNSVLGDDRWAGHYGVNVQAHARTHELSWRLVHSYFIFPISNYLRNYLFDVFDWRFWPHWGTLCSVVWRKWIDEANFTNFTAKICKYDTECQENANAERIQMLNWYGERVTAIFQWEEFYSKYMRWAVAGRLTSWRKRHAPSVPYRPALSLSDPTLALNYITLQFIPASLFFFYCIVNLTGWAGHIRETWYHIVFHFIVDTICFCAGG